MITPAPGPAGLIVEDLTVRRGNRVVVDTASLTVPAGSITAVLGPNGAGKSTLVLAIAGLLPKAAGHVRLGEKDLTWRRPDQIRAGGLATVLQGHPVLSGLDVADNLRVAGVRLTRRGRAERREQILELFPELAPRLHQLAGVLSGGERQMLALAQAVLDPPRALLLDEPFLGLAPVVVRRLVPVVRRIAGNGTAVLLIEQLTGLALALASSVAFMHRGRLGAAGDASFLEGGPGLVCSAYRLGPSQALPPPTAPEPRGMDRPATPDAR